MRLILSWKEVDKTDHMEIQFLIKFVGSFGLRYRLHYKHVSTCGFILYTKLKSEKATPFSVAMRRQKTAENWYRIYTPIFTLPVIFSSILGVILVFLVFTWHHQNSNYKIIDPPQFLTFIKRWSSSVKTNNQTNFHFERGSLFVIQGAWPMWWNLDIWTVIASEKVLL